MRNWEEWIGRHDMYWEELPESWEDAPFLGNGTMGAQFYHNKKEKALHVELGRNDICDTREGQMDGMSVCYQNPRLPIGAIELAYKGDVKRFRMRLDIYRALIEGELVTTVGSIAFRMLVHTEEMLLMMFTRAAEGEDGAIWHFVQEKAVSPRQQFGLERQQEFRILKNYRYNSDPVVTGDDWEGYSCQALDGGRENVVCWKSAKNEEEICTLVHVVQGENGVYRQAADYVNRFQNPAELLPAHYSWWAEYYTSSSISIPDKTLEDFYWIQIYKLACASRNRKGAAVMDNLGPWLCCSTPWPATWWNLNVQLAYLPCYVSNHLELTHSLSNRLLENWQQLIDNVPEEYRYDSAGIGTASTLNLRSQVNRAGTDEAKGFRELGNLTWVMHNCWLYYQMTMDQDYLKEVVWPLLRRCVNYYLHFLTRGEDGYYHLPHTSSPEYGKDCPDCNYDLALLRFGCRTLLEITDILKMKDEKMPMWKDVLENLVPYPVDETGYMIGAGLPYGHSHRHFSHLMMIYPLQEFTVENPELLELLQKSVEHWWRFPEAMAGFSCTIGSLLWSTLGDGDKALDYLKRLWSGFLLKNTLYKEDGPVIETPLSGAQSILEMLIQSYGQVIRLFPAMPSSWKEASFEGLLAQGGFEVNASYREGELSGVRIFSKAGMPCVVQSSDWDKMDLADSRIQPLEHNRIRIHLKKGETIEIKRSV